MASYFTHSIFDPLSCTGTQWIVDKVMLEHSLHSVLICDIHTARFPLDCTQAAVCPCTLFRVRCLPHSEGCAWSCSFNPNRTGNLSLLLLWLVSAQQAPLPVPANHSQTRPGISLCSLPILSLPGRGLFPVSWHNTDTGLLHPILVL